MNQPTPSYSRYVKIWCLFWMSAFVWTWGLYLFAWLNPRDIVRIDPDQPVAVYLFFLVLSSYKACLSYAIWKGKSWTVSVGYFDALFTLIYFGAVFVLEFSGPMLPAFVPHSRSLGFTFLLYLPYFVNFRKMYRLYAIGNKL